MLFVSELYKWISESHSELNVLVTNAGIQQWMTISDADFFARAKMEIAANIEAPLHLIFTIYEFRIVGHNQECNFRLIFCTFLQKRLYVQRLKHDTAPPVSDLIDSIFERLKEGKTELNFGFSKAMSKANAEDLKNAFNRLNPE
ncbi:MAG: hypothetical protein M3015_14885 [Bacteroidota bacterium]|nr:hypothetical protein [Bacteroidota bacterium]